MNVNWFYTKEDEQQCLAAEQLRWLLDSSVVSPDLHVLREGRSTRLPAKNSPLLQFS
jgi:hypothetical protein